MLKIMLSLLFSVLLLIISPLQPIGMMPNTLVAFLCFIHQNNNPTRLMGVYTAALFMEAFSPLFFGAMSLCALLQYLISNYFVLRLKSDKTSMSWFFQMSTIMSISYRVYLFFIVCSISLSWSWMRFVYDVMIPSIHDILTSMLIFTLVLLVERLPKTLYGMLKANKKKKALYIEPNKTPHYD